MTNDPSSLVPSGGFWSWWLPKYTDLDMEQFCPRPSSSLQSDDEHMDILQDTEGHEAHLVKLIKNFMQSPMQATALQMLLLAKMSWLCLYFSSP